MGNSLLGWWTCRACGAQNSIEDGECQHCECDGAACERDACSDPRHFGLGTEDGATPEFLASRPGKNGSRPRTLSIEPCV